mmetsp:Transcript_145194/g.465207  ORF Transcript_145194/g.465207 Transcript_145194/m.465207 type:complete len:308 (-) Transcript_145194:109-1032(-)
MDIRRLVVETEPSLRDHLLHEADDALRRIVKILVILDICPVPHDRKHHVGRPCSQEQRDAFLLTQTATEQQERLLGAATRKEVASLCDVCLRIVRAERLVLVVARNHTLHTHVAFVQDLQVLGAPSPSDGREEAIEVVRGHVETVRQQPCGATEVRVDRSFAVHSDESNAWHAEQKAQVHRDAVHEGPTPRDDDKVLLSNRAGHQDDVVDRGRHEGPTHRVVIRQICPANGHTCHGVLRFGQPVEQILSEDAPSPSLTVELADAVSNDHDATWFSTGCVRYGASCSQVLNYPERKHEHGNHQGRKRE